MSVSSIPFVRVYDTTLREGEQSPLATITPEVKLEVIGVLDELGVDVVEAGFPRAQPSDIEVYKKARERISSTELSGFARAVKGDIDMVVEAGADIVQVFIPGSDVQLKAMMGVTWDEAIEKLRASVDYASSRGLKVYVAVTDAPRSDREVLARIVKASVGSGADEVVLADTLGIASPGEISEIVSATLENGAPMVGLHLHNDLGLATCNALSGIKAGAREVQVTLGGIGERLGNTPLEELAAIARVKGLYRTNIRYDKLIPLVRKALNLMNVDVSPIKPVIGDYAFLHVSDIHVYSTYRFPGSFEGFPPEILGGHRVVRFGKLTGPKAVRYSLASKGIEVSDDEARIIAREVRRRSRSVDSMSLEDLVDLARSLLERRDQG